MVPNDDQKRVMTPAKAIEAGANRVVVGRPITQARNRRDAVLRTIDEIAEAAS
jgi:orotidine-5'-phosphate decarboxylase